MSNLPTVNVTARVRPSRSLRAVFPCRPRAAIPRRRRKGLGCARRTRFRKISCGATSLLGQFPLPLRPPVRNGIRPSLRLSRPLRGWQPDSRTLGKFPPFKNRLVNGWKG